MSELNAVIEALIRFRDERDWKQFHDSKNLATAISIEAAELNELFLWKNGEEAEMVNKSRLKEELADVMAYCILLAHKHGLDVTEIILDKIAANSQKYPVEKAKGTSKKYNEL